MDTNLPYFSLPIENTDNGSVSYTIKNKIQDSMYDEFSHTLHSGALHEADVVLEQFLSADDPLEEPDLNGPTELHCEICHKKFDNAKKYYGHLRVHSKENLWICDKCPNQRFTTKQHLMKHCLTHKPLEKIWKCPHCPMAFEALYRLQQHMFAKHLNNRPHKCEKCEKTFLKLSDLKKHQDVHLGNHRYVCKECERKFSDKSNLKRHLLTHNKEKPYCCSGCGARFTQLASLKRHSQRCSAQKLQDPSSEPPASIRQHHCRVCGMKFQYKSALLEHCVRQHSNTEERQTEKVPPKEKKELKIMPAIKFSNENNNKNSHINISISHANNHNNTQTVDTIVDDILSVEDDYSIVNTNRSMAAQNEILSIAFFEKNQEQNMQTEADKNAENLLHIEFLKEMNQLHSLDDELFYNDIDFESVHPNQVFNASEDYNAQDRNTEVLFDFTDGGRSIDQDLMNALYHVRAEHLPDELLNVSEANVFNDNDLLGNTVNECATIFESDVDLEASTNLAANLNQLIGENSVQYISTEDDDTFIISLNNGIDAEKLTDILNIADSNNENGYEIDVINESSNIEEPQQSADQNVDVIYLKIGETGEQKRSEEKSDTVKPKKQVLHICRVCNKVFTRKNNYWSHMGKHDSSLSQHKCAVCGIKFTWRSSLNKHMASMHEPKVIVAHTCDLCDRQYKAAWMLKNHIERDHKGLKPFKCDIEGCDKSFYKKSDRDLHIRFHKGEKPYKCSVCARGFTHKSHLIRHNKGDAHRRKRKSGVPSLIHVSQMAVLKKRGRPKGSRDLERPLQVWIQLPEETPP